MRKVHIRTLSKLAYAAVVDWQRILDDLRKSRDHRFWSYKPLRDTIAERIAHPGLDRNELLTRLSDEAVKYSPKCVSPSLAAFEQFEDILLPSISGLSRNLMTENGDAALSRLEPVLLVGRPHLEVRDAGDSRRFLYIHASKNWSDLETDAFCELLLVVLEQQYDAAPQELWFCDLHKGQLVVPRSSRKRVRQRLHKTARLLDQVMGAIESGGEALA